MSENDVVTPTKAMPPIDASSTDTSVIVRNLVLQVIGLTGAIIALLGLSETTWVVKIYRFASSEAFVPILGMILGLGASLWQLRDSRLFHREKQVLTLLPTTPDSVAIPPANPSKAVTLAVEQATKQIEHDAPVLDRHPSGQ